MGRKQWTTALLVVAAALTASGSVMTAEAKTAGELWRYQTAMDEEGNVIYDFQEVSVTIPAKWEGKYRMETGYDAKTETGYVSVYHRASADTGKVQSWKDYERGLLFELECGTDYSFMDLLSDYWIIGNGEGTIYYVYLPDKAQSSAEDGEILAEFEQLKDDLDWVIDHMKITNPGGGAVDMDQVVDENAGKYISEADTEYLLADSSEVRLTEADLKGMNVDQLQMAINEIYARHGRKFVMKEVQEYFESKSWYRGTVEAEKFDPQSLTQLESENIALMLQCMNHIAGSDDPFSGTLPGTGMASDAGDFGAAGRDSD